MVFIKHKAEGLWDVEAGRGQNQEWVQIGEQVQGAQAVIQNPKSGKVQKTVQQSNIRNVGKHTDETLGQRHMKQHDELATKRGSTQT